jgi:predicted  nucleic acid-binding Zn-ribbon protein
MSKIEDRVCDRCRIRVPAQRATETGWYTARFLQQDLDLCPRCGQLLEWFLKQVELVGEGDMGI